MKIKDFKMKVTPEQNRRVQEILFENGYAWASGDRYIKYTDVECNALFFDNDVLTFEKSPSEKYFKSEPSPELTYEEFIELYEPFVLPEKWCVKVTPDNKEVLDSWRVHPPAAHGYLHVPVANPDISLNSEWCSEIKDEYAEITFEQFKKYVLKQENLMEKRFVRVVDTGASYSSYPRAKELGCTNYHYWHNRPTAKNGDLLEIVKEITMGDFCKAYILKNSEGIEFIILKRGVELVEEPEKKLIGYKLKDETLSEAVEALRYKAFSNVDVQDGVYRLDLHDHSIENFKRVGVLDLWFEPVYEFVKKSTFLPFGKVDVEVFDTHVQFGNDRIDAHRIRNVYVNLFKQYVGKYSIEVDLSSKVKIGCAEGTLAQLKAIGRTFHDIRKK